MCLGILWAALASVALVAGVSVVSILQVGDCLLQLDTVFQHVLLP